MMKSFKKHRLTKSKDRKRTTKNGADIARKILQDLEAKLAANGLLKNTA